MKKNKNFISVVVSFTLIFIAMACNASVNDTKIETETQKMVEKDEKTGSASFSLVIPDYYAMAGLKNNDRAIAPQTARIKFSYKKLNNWIVNNTVNLSETEKTVIPNTPEGFSGSLYKCTLTNIPSGNYIEGTMKVELLDSADNVISSGTNSDIVNIIPNKTTQARFYTIPTSTSASSGSLAAGEMKFLKYNFTSEYSSAMSISVEDGNTYPDLVVFNENGMFNKYIHISSDNDYINCADYKGTTKYLGFWSANATSYSVSIGFGYEYAFDNILSNRDWEIWSSGNSPITKTNRGVRFDGESGGWGKIKRKVFLDQPKSLSFQVQTNLYEKYDGSLQFLIDDVIVATYTGKNSNWENEVFEIGEGIHTIEWRRDDSISSHSTGKGILFASITNCTFGEPIQAIESINQDFETELDTNMWIGGGLSASIVYDDDVAYGKVYKLGVYEDSNQGNSSLKILKIALEQAKTLSFDYSCDLVYNANEGNIKDYFRVYIDKSEYPVFEKTGPKGWKTGTITIPAGIHSVKFSVEKTYDADGRYWYNSGANAVFLDNIRLDNMM